jgi:hypothetical protein
MVEGTWQMKGSMVVQSVTAQPYLKSTPAATWYSAWLFMLVVLEGSSPKNWSYLTAAEALVQLLPAAALSVLKVQVLQPLGRPQ